MRRDSNLPLKELKVDGGAARNDTLLQMQVDLLGATARRPVVAETTALGAAYLAGLAVEYWQGLDDVTANWALDREFRTQMAAAERERRLTRWKKAVSRSLAWEEKA
jgi:glycerol kinase